MKHTYITPALTQHSIVEATPLLDISYANKDYDPNQPKLVEEEQQEKTSRPDIWGEEW